MDDEKIIALFFERSENAIKELLSKFGHYCSAIAMNILSNREDAEECVNDAALAVWNRLPPERPRKLSVYVGRLTRNIALDRFDYKTASKRNGSLAGIFEELEGCLASPEEVQDELDFAETSRLINEFLCSAPSDSRNIFLRRYWFCDSVKDIAKRFSISESKVKSVLFRERNRLKIYLEENGVSV